MLRRSHEGYVQWVEASTPPVATPITPTATMPNAPTDTSNITWSMRNGPTHAAAMFRRSRLLDEGWREDLGYHSENQPVEGFSSGATTESTEWQSQELEEFYDPLQKVAEFLTALIKRTAESENWPLVNWLNVQKRYRDLMKGLSDVDLYEEYRKYFDFRRGNLDTLQLFAWTGVFEIDQLVRLPNFANIGVIEIGDLPGNVYVMVDTPDAPISRIQEYTDIKRRNHQTNGTDRGHPPVAECRPTVQVPDSTSRYQPCTLSIPGDENSVPAALQAWNNTPENLSTDVAAAPIALPTNNPNDLREPPELRPVGNPPPSPTSEGTYYFIYTPVVQFLPHPANYDDPSIPPIADATNFMNAENQENLPLHRFAPTPPHIDQRPLNPDGQGPDSQDQHSSPLRDFDLNRPPYAHRFW
ncbi:hypothetical protein Aduo_018323 [Ancylostoma duodenale]